MTVASSQTQPLRLAAAVAAANVWCDSHMINQKAERVIQWQTAAAVMAALVQNRNAKTSITVNNAASTLNIINFAHHKATAVARELLPVCDPCQPLTCDDAGCS